MPRQPDVDSVAVVGEFVGNAGAILDSLTALRYSRRREATLRTRLRRVEKSRDSLGYELARSSYENTQTLEQRVDLTALVANYRRKRRRDQVEIWLWRIGAGVGGVVLYKKVCPMCPPR